MELALHHVFVCGAAGGPEMRRLLALGFREGSGNVHRGQGTANRRVFFENAMLELLWVCDEAQVRDAAIARTQLWERSRSSHTGASPFGICLAAADPRAETLPFETWGYAPPYVPAGMEIPVARTLSVAEPIVLVLPGPMERREPTDHPNGARSVGGVRLTLAHGTALSPALEEIARLGIVTFAHGSEPLLELTFDGGRQGERADMRPELPLVLRW